MFSRRIARGQRRDVVRSIATNASNPLAKAIRPVIEGLEVRRLFTTIVVNSNSGGIDPSESVTTLREAITMANELDGADTIQLIDTVYTFTEVDNAWFGPNALPAITSEITIEGNGALIQRSGSSETPKFRLFYVVGMGGAGIDTGLEPGNLTLKNLTLQNGVAEGGAGGERAGGGAGLGGAIYSQGLVTLSGVLVAGNVARGGAGGTDSDSNILGYGGGGGLGGDGADASFAGGGGGGFVGNGGFGDFAGGGGGGFAGNAGAGNGSGGGGGGFAGLGGNGNSDAGGGGGGAFGGTGGTAGTDQAPNALSGGDGGLNSGGGGGGQGGNIGGFNDGLPGNGGAGGFGGGGGGGGRSAGSPFDNTDLGAGGDGGFGAGGGGGGPVDQAPTTSEGQRGGDGGVGGGGGGSYSGRGGNGGFGAGGGAGNILGGNGGFGGGGGATLEGTQGEGGFGGGDGLNASNDQATLLYGGGGAGLGGGIFNDGGHLTIYNATFSNNAALGGASSGNTGKGYGGAIFTKGGIVEVTNVTISANTAQAGAGIYYYSEDNNLAAVKLYNSVLGQADNSTTDLEGFGSGVELTAENSQVRNSSLLPKAADPKLGELTDNFGYNSTMAPASNSPLIDAGDVTYLPESVVYDQRGPNFNRVQGVTVDIGAFETAPVIALPVVSIGDVEKEEGNAGQSPMTFFVTLSAPAPSAVTVTYHTVNGTATAGSDYVATSGTVTISQGGTYGLLYVNLIGDTVKGPDENFKVILDSATNATIGDGEGRGTIKDDDSVSQPPNPPAPTPGPVATPTNFTGTALSASQVKLNWKDNSSAGNTFEIQYSRGFDFKDFKTLVTPANATTATVEGLSKNKVYYFRVREIGVGSARSSWSSKLTVRTLNTGGPVVNPPAPTPVITAFMLVNSDTNQPVYQISEGEQLSKSSILAYLGVQNFSIQANTDGGVKSVKFGYQGNGNYSKENNAPFVLFGNSGADIFGKSAAIGSYTVSATGYTGNNLTGTASALKTLHFSIVA